MLRVLELLYRVNALVDVLALEVVDIELRQLCLLAELDSTELEETKSGPALRIDGGDAPRGPLRSTEAPFPKENAPEFCPCPIPEDVPHVFGLKG